MAEYATPPSVEELIQFISSFVREQFESAGRRTTGAALADAVRKRFPDLSYDQLGLSKLADLVHLAEKAGALVRHRDVQHLEVSPSGATPRSSVGLSGPTSYVRPELWRAFLFVTGRDVHFLERDTGRLITLSPDQAPQVHAYDGDPRFIRITTIAPETQKEWMHDFLRSRSLDVNAAPMNVERWWSAFPEWLRNQGNDYGSAWPRFRAERVVPIIKQWARDNGLLPDLLFSLPSAAPRSKEKAGGGAEDDATRNAVLAAIRELPFEQLQDFAIPVKYLLRHFRAR